MLFEVLAIWGCLPEWNSTTYECANFDMSNAASTWIGLICRCVNWRSYNLVDLQQTKENI